MFRRILLAAVSFSYLAAAPHGAQALAVFACVPEWAELAQELGGSRVEASSATTARQDPHRIEPRPGLIARLRNADLVVCTGAELEVGWLPVLLRQSSNPRVQPGSPGYFEAAEFVRLVEIPNRLDRADGDVHAAGNPHIQTDPRNIRRVAEALGKRLAAVDPAGAAVYAERTRDFLARWDAAIARWEAQAAPLRGVAVLSQHRNWGYLIGWLGLEDAGTIEPKPGVPPGPQHLAGVVEEAPVRKVRAILRAAYEDARPARFVGERTGISVADLAFTVGGTAEAGDLFALFDDTVRRLLEAAHAS
ncbi:MAG: zinc ABC transporter substrate-binding protein [Proteobacteria bacterium]|nr:zinc ABC transporter substrate-binding protein [Pseudomonadota bacterium]